MEGVVQGPRPLRRERGVTLAEQLAASSNLRDLLKLRDDAHGEGEADGRPGRRRTLLDVIRGGADDDRPPAVAAGRGAVLPAPGGTGGTVTAASTAPAVPARGERVSLMALLERTDHQWTARAGGGGQWRRVEVAEEEVAEKGGGVGGRCCVCVARGKGAAFIPCGHTFCRACAAELRAGRGRCPLCNAAIREVLNLF